MEYRRGDPFRPTVVVITDYGSPRPRFNNLYLGGELSDSRPACQDIRIGGATRHLPPSLH